MHPRESRTTRRAFLFASGGTIAALSSADALLRAADALAAFEAGVPIGPGGIPLARRNHPLTLPLYSDNPPIDSGKSPEKGPLQVFNWADYVNPAVVKQFEKEYKVTVNVTTFENEEEALAKLTSGQGFDVWFATVEYLSRAVAGKLIQPVNHHYLSNLQNVWPSLQSPFYDQHSRYSVPYMSTRPESPGGTTRSRRPDVVREPVRHLLGREALLGQGRDPRRPTRGARDGVAAPPRQGRQYGERRQSSTARKRPEAADEARQRENERERLHGRPRRHDLALAGVVRRHGRRPQLHAEGRARLVISYWRPSKGAVVGSDMITILRGAKNPVLAHHFLNFLLDNKKGVENFSWIGYMPPLKVDQPRQGRCAGLHPEEPQVDDRARVRLRKRGLAAPADDAGTELWQDAWSKFKAG